MLKPGDTYKHPMCNDIDVVLDVTDGQAHILEYRLLLTASDVDTYGLRCSSYKASWLEELYQSEWTKLPSGLE